jgi:hypothetical protein
MHGNLLPIDQSNSLGDLAARITTAHEQVGLAARNALEHAMAAGDLLAEAKDRVGHGRWETWLKILNIPPRTASHYMRLAENRELIEAKSANVADLTIAAALRLIKPKQPKKADTGSKPTLVVTIPTQAGATLASAIQSEWRKASVRGSHEPHPRAGGDSDCASRRPPGHRNRKLF